MPESTAATAEANAAFQAYLQCPPTSGQNCLSPAAFAPPAPVNAAALATTIASAAVPALVAH